MRSTSEAAPKRKKKKSARARGAVKTAAGWREWAALPDLGVRRIKAKLDTGAKTSAIHAFGVRAFERDGEVFVSFVLHPYQRKARPEIACIARAIDRRRIRSSNGAAEERYIIMTRLRIGGREAPVELSLADRDAMGFRLLLGRDALRKSFVVDPGRSFLFGEKP